MAVDAIGVVTSEVTDIGRAGGIAQEDFLRILLTQFRFQDPLKPIDNQQFVAQLAQFTALEITRQQSEKIDTLLAIQAANQAIGLINQSVEVSSETGFVSGTVTAVSFSAGEPRLTVSTPSAVLIDVRLSQVSLVRPSGG